MDILRQPFLHIDLLSCTSDYTCISESQSPTSCLFFRASLTVKMTGVRLLSLEICDVFGQTGDDVFLGQIIINASIIPDTHESLLPTVEL